MRNLPRILKGSSWARDTGEEEEEDTWIVLSSGASTLALEDGDEEEEGDTTDIVVLCRRVVPLLAVRQELRERKCLAVKIGKRSRDRLKIILVMVEDMVMYAVY